MVQKPQASSSDSVLLDRTQAAQILNVAVITVKRIEADGNLTPVRLREGPTAKTYYSKTEVLNFAQRGISK